MLLELEARGCWLQDNEFELGRIDGKNKKRKRNTDRRHVDPEIRVRAKDFDTNELDYSSSDSSKNSQKAKRRFRLKKMTMAYFDVQEKDLVAPLAKATEFTDHVAANRHLSKHAYLLKQLTWLGDIIKREKR